MRIIDTVAAILVLAVVVGCITAFREDRAVDTLEHIHWPSDLRIGP